MKKKILILIAFHVSFFAAFSQSPVAHWGLNNNANDASGNSINGTLVNSPSFTTDMKEGSHALTLNGSNQYVNFGNPTSLPSGTSPRSISAWAKTNTVSGFHWIVSYGTAATSSAMFIGQSGTQLKGGGYANDLNVSNFWAVGVWHHLCLTYDGTTAKLYADGTLIASGVKTWNLALSKAYIGRQVNDSEYWNGSIDDVRIYNTALSASQVQALVTQPPASPTQLTATSASSSSINLTWTDASTNETGFQVERSSTSGSGFALINTTAADATSFTDTGLTSGTIYYYRIRAINSGGESAYTAEANATPMALPASPTQLIATSASSTSINLSWTDGSTNETGFQVERSSTSGSGFSLINTTTASATSFLDTGLTSGTIYYYRIRAINSSGQSAYTAEANATTMAVPASPTALIASATSSSSINLTWSDGSTNETAFQVERSLSSGSGFALVATTAANAVAHADNGLNPTTTYYYRVRAINTVGNSSYTPVVNATTLVPVPGAPSGAVATAMSSTSIDLGWTDNASNEVEFEIERSETSGNGFVLVGTVGANTVSFSDTSLISGITYYYRIRATNAGGPSAYSTEVNATTMPIEGGTQLCESIYCDEHGGVGIGTHIIPTGFTLAIKGKMMAEGVKVALESEWPDYVFKKDYNLTDIASLKKFIEENGHLPNIPAAKTVEKEGIDVGRINVLLLEKIEELSLYLIRMEERINLLESENRTLKAKNFGGDNR
ncbi:MAG: fibronectin type III domain-containing protein [Cyclobacteriaceae bacterium]